MSSQDKLNQIANLRSQIMVLKDQVNKADIESKKHVEKRDQLNQQTKMLNLEINGIKKQRDESNKRVQALKQQRDILRVKINPIMDEIQAIDEKKEELKKKTPYVRKQDIQKEIEKIDWKIQTETLDLQEEKRLVGEVKLLETQLSGYKKIEKENKKLSGFLQEKKTLDTQVRVLNKEISEFAKKSQELHEKMLAKFSEIKTVKKEADALHKGFIESKSKGKDLLVEIAVLTGQMLGLQNNVREQNKELREKEKALLLQEKEEADTLKNQKLLDEQELKAKLGVQAKEKLDKGEKLSWNEFQLLASVDETDDAETQK